MISRRYKYLIGSVILVAGICPSQAFALDGHRVTIPLPGKLTPVQRLNRDGVQAILKGNFKRAEGLFYKAYLYDPSDPFTLNNLGYVAELDDQLDRAIQFYSLAAEQGSNADIDRSNEEHLKGKPMRAALIDLQDAPMRVNRMNLDALRLLAQDRGFEAVALLKTALSLGPNNPFTTNNLGFASETTGDLESALKYYRAAAASHSAEAATVTLDSSWRGKPVSEMAAASAKRVEKRMHETGLSEQRAIMFTLRGVFAMNQNDWPSARENFVRAYSLDPGSAFTINNRGFVAEREGDLETAQYFYAKARNGDNAGARVGLATDLQAEGRQLSSVASDSDNKVDAAIDVHAQLRHREAGPIELTPRGDSLPTAKQGTQQAPETAQPTTQQHPQ